MQTFSMGNNQCQGRIAKESLLAGAVVHGHSYAVSHVQVVWPEGIDYPAECYVVCVDRGSLVVHLDIKDAIGDLMVHMASNSYT